MIFFRCECLAGWIGNDCQINEDDCVYNRCENGATCVDGINEYICKCRPGYAGQINEYFNIIIEYSFIVAYM